MAFNTAGLGGAIAQGVKGYMAGEEIGIARRQKQQQLTAQMKAQQVAQQQAEHNLTKDKQQAPLELQTLQMKVDQLQKETDKTAMQNYYFAKKSGNVNAMNQILSSNPRIVKQKGFNSVVKDKDGTYWTANLGVDVGSGVREDTNYRKMNEANEEFGRIHSGFHETERKFDKALREEKASIRTDEANIVEDRLKREEQAVRKVINTPNTMKHALSLRGDTAKYTVGGVEMSGDRAYQIAQQIQDEQTKAEVSRGDVKEELKAKPLQYSEAEVGRVVKLKKRNPRMVSNWSDQIMEEGYDKATTIIDGKEYKVKDLISASQVKEMGREDVKTLDNMLLRRKDLNKAKALGRKVNYKSVQKILNLDMVDRLIEEQATKLGFKGLGLAKAAELITGQDLSINELMVRMKDSFMGAKDKPTSNDLKFVLYLKSNEPKTTNEKGELVGTTTIQPSSWGSTKDMIGNLEATIEQNDIKFDNIVNSNMRKSGEDATYYRYEMDQLRKEPEPQPQQPTTPEQGQAIREKAEQQAKERQQAMINQNNFF